MPFPKQLPPLQRPHLINLHSAVDVTHGSVQYLNATRIGLLHEADYNGSATFNKAYIQSLNSCCVRCALEDTGIIRKDITNASCGC